MNHHDSMMRLLDALKPSTVLLARIPLPERHELIDLWEKEETRLILDAWFDHVAECDSCVSTEMREAQ
jgi:hypothetical protein